MTTQKKQSTIRSQDFQSGDVMAFLQHVFYIYLPPYLFQNLLITIGVLLSVVLETAIPLSLRILIDDAIANQDRQLLIRVFAGLIGLLLISSLSDFVQGYMRVQFGAELLKDLRLMLFSHLQRLPSSYFDQSEPGEITALFAKELIAVRDVIRNMIVQGLRPLIQFLITAVALFILEWRLALLVVLVVYLTYGIPRWVLKRATVADFQNRLKHARVAHAVQDNVTAQAVIHAYGLGDTAIAQFAEKIGRGQNKASLTGYARFLQDLNHPTFLRSLISILTNTQQTVATGLAIGVGAYLAFTGSLTLGTFTTFVALLPKVGKSITGLSNFLQELIVAASSFERIQHLIYTPSRIDDFGLAQPLAAFTDRIHFADVTFRYNEEKVALSKVSLDLFVGRSVAILGPNGAGKSTLLKLILRLYNPDFGLVQIDGRDLRMITRASLNVLIGIVLQETILLNTSIRENIRLVNPDATDLEIVTAAQEAEVHEAIMRLPLGYETIVGEGGKRLSLGERQRVALARALVRKPAILLLDQPAASLDTTAKLAIDNTIDRLAKERTVIMTTHRLTAAARMEHIVIMIQGEVREEGTHEALLAQKGYYFKLWQEQSKNMDFKKPLDKR